MTSQADGGPGRLSDVEALMWRLGAHDARLRPIITVVAVLDRSPGIDAVAERAAALVAAVPRFACRVAPPVAAVAPPRLVPEAQLDLGAHLRLVSAPGEGTLQEVLAMVGPMVAEGLDPTRPLWHMTLVEAMDGGRACLVVRLHHCLTDGVGALALAAVLFGAGGEAAGGAARVLGHGGVGSSLGDLVGDLRREARLGLGLWRAAMPAAGRALLEALSPPPPPGVDVGEGPEAPLARTARSLGGALAPGGGPCSAVLTGRSASVALGALDVDLAEVRAAGAAAGGTVNDVFVAAVLDGVARYHAKHGEVGGDLRVAVPVDLRGGPAGDGAANHVFPARIVAPLEGTGVAGRIGAVHALVRRARDEPAIAAFDAVAAVAARLPGAEALAARAMLGVDVVASNVPGSPTPLALAGAGVRQLIPFGPRSGAACNVTTVSYAGRLHIGVNVDPAAAPDGATLLACLADAFADAVAGA